MHAVFATTSAVAPATASVGRRRPRGAARAVATTARGVSTPSPNGGPRATRGVARRQGPRPPALPRAPAAAGSRRRRSVLPPNRRRPLALDAPRY
eukprot:30465-Pelagococcus_subviridis.AAC.3